jgi:hypothetical protein
MQFVPGISSAQTMQAAELVDSRQLAGFGSLRLHTVVGGTDVHCGTERLGRGRYLSLRRRLWRDAPSLARNDSSVRRPCAISAFSMAFHLCADFLVVVFAASPVWDLKGIVIVTFILEKF